MSHFGRASESQSSCLCQSIDNYTYRNYSSKLYPNETHVSVSMTRKLRRRGLVENMNHNMQVCSFNKIQIQVFWSSHSYAKATARATAQT